MVFTGISLNCVWKQPAGNYKLLLPFVQKKLQIECQLRLLSGTDNKESLCRLNKEAMKMDLFFA